MTGLATRESLSVTTVTNDQLDLIRKTIAKDATPDELKLYLYDCQRQGVHPLDKLIHFTKRSGRYTPVTSIDFMRMRAAETNEYAGSDVPLFADTDGVWSSLWIKDSPPVAAMVTVWRLVQGTRCKFEAVARWAEYKPESNDFMWRKMPATMLAKCAEALSLRKGFPKQLAGLYAREEMAQAESPVPIVKAPQRVEAPNPEHIEAEAEVVATRPPAPPGAVYIEECTPSTHAKKAGEVTLSNGEIATVWKSNGQLFDLAMVLCQEGRPVVATTSPGTGNYGPTLKGLKRLDAEHDQRREQSEVPEPPPIDDKDLPF